MSYGLEGRGGEGWSPAKAAGQFGIQREAPGLAGFPEELQEPFGGARWRGLVSKVEQSGGVMGWDLTLVSYLESKC